MADLRPDIGAALAVFGLPATVTVPGGDPVATTAIWLPPLPVETVGVFTSTDKPQPRLSVPRSAFGGTSVPRGTRVDLAEVEGGPVLSWTVESVDAELVDEVRLIVIPAEV
jgi:hypothetical protein